MYKLDPVQKTKLLQDIWKIGLVVEDLGLKDMGSREHDGTFARTKALWDTLMQDPEFREPPSLLTGGEAYRQYMVNANNLITEALNDWVEPGKVLDIDNKISDELAATPKDDDADPSEEPGKKRKLGNSKFWVPS